MPTSLDILGDVDMHSVFGLIFSILFSCLPVGSSWRWCDLRWRINKAVSDLQGVEPAVLLSVKFKGKTAGGGVNLTDTSGTSTLNVGAVFIRHMYAAYRRVFLINNPDKPAHYYQLIQHKRTCHIICRSTDDLRRGLKLSVQEAD